MNNELTRVPENENNITVSASQAEATIERAKMILKLIAKHIRTTEIRLFGDNLHFERGACEKILMWAGAKIKMDHNFNHERIVDEKGDVYYDYEIWGTLEIDGRTIDVMGNCSTRSDFFGTKGGEFKPLSEIDIPSIKQAAITNLWNHACVRGLGLKSMTLDDLKAAGMDTSKIGSVSYEKSGQGGSTITPEEKQQQVKMGNWLLEMNGGDKTAAAEALKKATAFMGKDQAGNPKQVEGLDSCAKLTGKRLAIAYSKIFTDYQAHCKKNGLPMPENGSKPAEVLPVLDANR